MKLTSLEKKDIIMSKIKECNEIIIILKDKNKYENSLETKNPYTIYLIEKEIEKNIAKINALNIELNSL